MFNFLTVDTLLIIFGAGFIICGLGIFYLLTETTCHSCADCPLAPPIDSPSNPFAITEHS